MNKKTKHTLRRFTQEDALALHQALSDKRVVKHMASEGFTLEACKKIVSDSPIHWDKYAIGDYAVEDKSTNTIIGWAGFKFWKDNEFEILIVLSPKFWGLGRAICDELIYQAKHKFLLSEIYILLPETRKQFRWIQRKGFQFCGDELFNSEPFEKFVKQL